MGLIFMFNPLQMSFLRNQAWSMEFYLEHLGRNQKILSSLTQGVMGPVYLPEAVLVETEQEGYKPTLCYRADPTELKPTNSQYLDPFVKSALDLIDHHNFLFPMLHEYRA